MKEDSIKYLMSFMENFNRNNYLYFDRSSRTEYHGPPSTFLYQNSHFRPQAPVSFAPTSSESYYSSSHQKNIPPPSRSLYSNSMGRPPPPYRGSHMIDMPSNAAMVAALQQQHMMMNHQLSPAFNKEPSSHNSKIPSSQPFLPSYSPMTSSHSFSRPSNSLTHDTPLHPFLNSTPSLFNQYTGHFYSSPISYQQQRQHFQPTQGCGTSLPPPTSSPQILNHYSVSSGEAGLGSFTPQEVGQRLQILKNNPILEKLLDKSPPRQERTQQSHDEEESVDKKPEVGRLQLARQQSPPPLVGSSPTPPPEFGAKRPSRTYSPPPPVSSADSGIASLPPPTPPPSVHIKQEPIDDPQPSTSNRVSPPFIPAETANILGRLGTQISAAVLPENRIVENIITPAIIYQVPSTPTTANLPDILPIQKNTHSTERQFANGASNIDDSQAQSNTNTARKSFARMKLTPTLKDKERNVPSPQPNTISEEPIMPHSPSLLSNSNDTDFFPSSPASSCNSFSELDLTKHLLKIKVARLIADKQAKQNKSAGKSIISSYTCPLDVCPFESDSIFGLASHLSQHEDNLPIKTGSNYVCIICKRFKTRSLSCLTYHIHKEINYKPYQCKWCNSSFVASNFFVRHCRVKHLMLEPCPKICIDPKMKTIADSIVNFIERTQKIKEDYQKSPTSNMDDYKFFCPDCGVKLRDAIELQRHLYRDEKYFPYQCVYCFSTFVEWDQAHFRNKHPGLPIKFNEIKNDNIERKVGQLVEEQRFIRSIVSSLKKSDEKKCILGCNYEAPTEEDLEMHVISHLSTHPVKCPYCFVTTKTEEKMRFHLSRFHKKHPIMIFTTKEVLVIHGGAKSIENSTTSSTPPEVNGKSPVASTDNSCLLTPEASNNKHAAHEFSTNCLDLGSGKRAKLDQNSKKRAKSTSASKKKIPCTKPLTTPVSKPLDPTTQLSSSTLQMLSDGYFKPVKQECPAVKALLIQRQFLEALEAPENIDTPALDEAENTQNLPPILQPCSSTSAIAPTSISQVPSVAKPPPYTSRKSLIPPDAVNASSTAEPSTGGKTTARKSLIPMQALTSLPPQQSTIKKTARKSIKGSLSNIQQSLIESTRVAGPKARKSFPCPQRQITSHYRRRPSKPVDVSKVYYRLPLTFGASLVAVPVKLGELPFDIHPSLRLTSFLSSHFVEHGAN